MAGAPLACYLPVMNFRPQDVAFAAPPRALVDRFARPITYLRVSVTDRCDFRCVYCMSERMRFLPRSELLTLEELDRLCTAFIARGTKKLRITGGEPLLRHDVMTFFRSLARHLDSGALDELTLTTNGSQLARHAAELAQCGVKRLNLSLDTLDPAKFRAITRNGDLSRVLDGLEAALRAGIAVKINTVALKDANEDELVSLTRFAHERGMDISFIEVMPLGELDGAARIDQYLPLTIVRERLAQAFALEEIDYRSGGPARFWRARETGGRSASSRRSPIISARAATACASPAQASFTCAWAKRTAPILERLCARAPTRPRSTTRSKRRSCASPRAMIS